MYYTAQNIIWSIILCIRTWNYAFTVRNIIQHKICWIHIKKILHNFSLSWSFSVCHILPELLLFVILQRQQQHFCWLTTTTSEIFHPCCSCKKVTNAPKTNRSKIHRCNSCELIFLKVFVLWLSDALHGKFDICNHKKETAWPQS